MRVLKRILIIVGIAGLSFLLIAGGFIAYAAMDKKDTFFLRDAELADPQYLRNLAAEKTESRRPISLEHFAVYAHRLKRGNGTILAYRFWSGGDFAVIDDESYRKLTVWLASPPPSSKTELDLTDTAKAVVISSEGGSAWPDAGCSGYVSSGKLTIERSGASYLVSIHGILQPMGGKKSSRCNSSNIDIQFKAREIKYEQLTPWLGIAGPHVYRETYR